MNIFIRVRALLLVASIAASHAAIAQMVRLHTTQGPIDVNLLQDAPVTVANFLAYSRAGDYTDALFHRSAYNGTTPFVVQGGGYRWRAGQGCCETIASRGAIVNEFSATRSNVRGTVAMAKVGGNANSATSQWFINMGDNASNLDAQNGGFTVFGRVTAPGMVTADRIAALPRINLQNIFPELPVVGFQGGNVVRENTVRIDEVTEMPANPSTSDRIFNYLEAAYPQFLAPQKGVTAQALGYVYRYYGTSNSYVGTKDGTVWYLVPAISAEIRALGPVADWLAAAQGAGY